MEEGVRCSKCVVLFLTGAFYYWNLLVCFVTILYDTKVYLAHDFKMFSAPLLVKTQ